MSVGPRLARLMSSARRALFSFYATVDENGLDALIQAAGFWASILLPIGYLPLLVLGPDGVHVVVLVLVGLHLVALVVGHPHAQRETS